MYVDFHAHILPQADHGCENVEMALSQLKYAEEAGVDTVIATPHFYPDSDTVDEFLRRREEAYAALSGVYHGNVNIVLGAEVQLAMGIERLEGLEKLCIGDTGCLLVEFPPEPWPYWIFDSVTEIARTRRLRPICAHIDRYSHIGRAKILKLNMDVQLNASAFLESFRHRREYINLIADDEVHILGSDVHGDGKLAYRDFTRAVKKIGRFMPYLTENARKILARKNKGHS